MQRECVCDRNRRAVLCPFHAALDLLARTPSGGFLFPGETAGSPISYDKVNTQLKAFGHEWGAPNWKRWASHGWRRGLATETALSAHALEEVLKAGDWSKNARSYLLYIATIWGGREAAWAAESFAGESDESD